MKEEILATDTVLESGLSTPAVKPRRLRERLAQLASRLARRLDRMADTLEFRTPPDTRADTTGTVEFGRRPGDPVGAVYLDGERLGALPREVRRL